MPRVARRLARPALACRMGQNARRLIEEEHTLEAAGARITAALASAP